ncbi:MULTISPECIES: efflux RND transporter permease subunit [unclassified Clostridioides]|uniref:efflux RND transporter permease subunit n=1 Tax=unclassified Clostridioides TaxID=2635829 RepID=UPI001D0CC591|nr:efflux RND transporter permease subunit [Clostridioides sp. ES-S-0001-02]MCC0639125.1 efflux RND transporter permease subunit [Clostridioides sp. ES-S-0049-03]MCC0652865.1 efflux RND transporter permease subunit [Clostridioides sp. ES-S-0001-03]MCC0657148.1 efflux RND transporter permease subunit [Clostridioides sp. ES-S-0123-01]MCC0675515.1 efflux RND transporter permease subunit [Clostridioides sp. ES-W-0018-02]MCC0680132.1 efflux RND transporter permease subunit [Clostridioides sp. ES-S-
MNLTHTSVKRPLTIIMVFLVLIVFGGIGYKKMSINLMPDIEIPVVMVMTTWTGAGPQDVDEQVSQKVDESLSSVSNVSSTISSSQESVSMVVAQFEFGTNLDEIMNDVRSKVDALQTSLPDDAAKPTVLKLDMNAQAIGQLVISGGNNNAQALRKYAEDVIQPKIESIDGTTSADIKGGEKAQVNVIADPSVLSNYGVSLSTIKGILSSSNKTFPYGSITQGEDKIVLRSIDKLESLDDIKQIQIPVKGGNTVNLDTLCSVDYGFADKDSIYRYNGKSSLVIDISKQQDANTVKVMQDAYKYVDELNKENPQFKIKIANDTSAYISESINSVMSNLLISAVIAFVVIFAFLKSVRASLVVAVAIPISIIGAIAVLYFTGESLNLITASSLVISVGMVVDNATVVIENIFKYRKSGRLSIDDCAIEGTRTVTNAILASTLTTIAIFLPIMFTEGIAKITFGALGKTLIASLAFSFIGAITLVPSVFAKLSRGKSSEKMKEKDSPIFDKVSEGYKRLLSVCLRHQKLVVISSLLIFVASLFGMSFIGMDFMPAADKGELAISIELPKGLSLEANDYYVSMTEKKVSDIPEIKTLITSLTSDSNNNSASIAIELESQKNRKRTTDEIEKEIIDRVATVPDCKINVSQNSSVMGGTSGADFTLEMKGPDLDVLKILGKEVEKEFSSIKGFRNVETSLTDTTQEAQFTIDKHRAQEYGVNTAEIAGLLRTAINGDSVTTATIDDYKVDVNLKFKADSIDNLEDIKQLKVNSTTGNEVPLGAFSDIKMVDGLQSISRTDGDFSVNITATLDNLDAGTATKLALEKTNKMLIPKDYSIGVGGETEMMNESMASLGFSMVIAIALVYMVMVAQFESFSKPFIIMFCVPFAFVGVVLSLLVTGQSLSTVGMLGIILLIGIVVNNGIVLIDYIEQLRKANSSNDLIGLVSIGCAARLRPVLMTTATTILGMLPTALSLGEGGETMQPLAVVIMGGLTVSTLITLVLIPTIYLIFDKWENKFSDRMPKIFGKITDKIGDIKGKIFKKPKLKAKI